MSDIQNASWLKACPACGHGVSKRAKACPTCGHDMQPTPPAGNPKLLKLCPACGHTVSKRAFRCPGCGHRLASDLRMIWIAFCWIIIIGTIIGLLSAGAR